MKPEQRERLERDVSDEFRTRHRTSASRRLFDSGLREDLDAALTRIDELEARLARLDSPCTCGHAPDFCHKLNAKKWCGLTDIAELRAALEGE